MFCLDQTQLDKYRLNLIDEACHKDPDGFYCAEIYNDGFNETMKQQYTACAYNVFDVCINEVMIIIYYYYRNSSASIYTCF